MSPAPCFRTEKVLKNKAIFILKKLLDNLGGGGGGVGWLGVFVVLFLLVLFLNLQQ